eukprot:scaffold283496_cov16-Prasinocladus_malaysianus.AAC.1
MKQQQNATSDVAEINARMCSAGLKATGCLHQGNGHQRRLHQSRSSVCCTGIRWSSASTFGAIKLIYRGSNAGQHSHHFCRNPNYACLLWRKMIAN